MNMKLFRFIIGYYKPHNTRLYVFILWALLLMTCKIQYLPRRDQNNGSFRQLMKPFNFRFDKPFLIQDKILFPVHIKILFFSFSPRLDKDSHTQIKRLLISFLIVSPMLFSLLPFRLVMTKSVSL
jgi:hypothetical protein